MFKKQHHYKKMGVLVALVYWLFDSSVHYWAYGEQSFEFIPSELNELWMRSLIFLQFIVFGYLLDRHVSKLLQSQKRYFMARQDQEKAEFARSLASEQLQRELDKADIYLATVKASQHIVNTMLNQLMLIKMEAENSKDFSKEVLKDFDTITQEASGLLAKLSSVQKVSKENIHFSIHKK